MSKTDYDLLSTAPPEEPCAQVGDDAADPRAEGKRYIELLRKVLGPEPEGSKLKLRANAHDLGTYYSVAYFFDDDVEEHIKYMQRLDNDGPLNWEDDQG